MLHYAKKIILRSTAKVTEKMLDRYFQKLAGCCCVLDAEYLKGYYAAVSEFSAMMVGMVDSKGNGKEVNL